ncbi:MAG: response regulator transcription factor, partial [Enterococcus sp.]|nr:response regulator transcription factor [Enterococcus sp.]
MKILIIDDHELFSYSLKLVIEKYSENNQVSIKSDSSKIEYFLTENEIDIILLDINLKNENGLVVGENIKVKHPEIPLVFLTGFDLPEYRLQAKKINADGFISKNTKPEKLITSLEEIIVNGESVESIAEDVD